MTEGLVFIKLTVPLTALPLMKISDF
jgi:hypothetical protein